MGNNELSNFDLIIIGLIILIVMYYIKKIKVIEKFEAFNLHKYQQKQYDDNLLNQDTIMRNQLNDFITTKNLNKVYSSNSLYNEIKTDKPDLDPYFAFEDKLPTFENKIIQKEEPQFFMSSTNNKPSNFGINKIEPLSQEYTDDAVFSGISLTGTTAQNEQELLADF